MTIPNQWIAHLAAEGGKFYQRDVRDGVVIVRRIISERNWSVFHNGRFVRNDHRTAREAMEHVDEAEMYA